MADLGDCCGSCAQWSRESARIIDPHSFMPDNSGDDLTAEMVRQGQEVAIRKAGRIAALSAPVAGDDAGMREALDAAKSLIKQKLQKLEWSRDDCQSKGQEIYVANLEAQIERWRSHLAALAVPSTNGETATDSIGDKS